MESANYINSYGVDTRIQYTALNLLLEFHEFCIAHELSYYIHAGTVLGAVRHKGFIPWDDDIDVCMPRNDYEKLLTLSKEFKSEYRLASYKTISDGSYPYQWAKLEDTRTHIVETCFPNGRKDAGIFIDIFPLDKFPNTYKKRKHWVNKSIKWKIYLLSYYHYYDQRKAIRPFWSVVRFFLKLNNKGNSLHQKADKAMIKDFESDYSGDIFGWDMQGVMPTKWYGTPKLYEFEGYKFFGPQHAHDYLNNAYGNYKKLPPMEYRKAAHGYDFEILTPMYLEHLQKTID